MKNLLLLIALCAANLVHADELEEAIKLQDAGWVFRAISKKDSAFYQDSFKYLTLAQAHLQNACDECEIAASTPLQPSEVNIFAGHGIKILGVLTGICLVNYIEDITYRWTGVVVAAALAVLGVNDFRSLRQVKYEHASKKFDKALEIKRIVAAAKYGALNNCEQ